MQYARQIVFSVIAAAARQIAGQATLLQLIGGNH